MSKKNVKTILAILCTVFAITGSVFIGKGFDKKDNYSNPDNDDYNFSLDYVNSYVGGDAYNYIINGTYFTAYAVLGMGFLIMSTISGVTYLVLACKDKEEKMSEKVLNAKEESVVESTINDATEENASPLNTVVAEETIQKCEEKEKQICPECKNEVECGAKTCPNCGYPFE